MAVTHDRWFARGFDRFLVFGSDGRVYESAEPVWDEGRVVRPLSCPCAESCPRTGRRARAAYAGPGFAETGDRRPYPLGPSRNEQGMTLAL